ncbi:peptide methionine sulfoxide reductase [Spongiimicrobium salis]|uniref:peptide methionine sulfoxide reductase n=1 Tax=Spongiimicrobium salis TaxID=1667022 RepID=UPI00374C9C6A
MQDSERHALEHHISRLPLGFSKVQYQGKTYGVSKRLFNQGKSVKVYAEELGGTDFISFNYYTTLSQNALKPCEMPEAKVKEFLAGYHVI